MKVKDLMTHHTDTCTMSSDLEQVSLCMWNGDFGIMPVTDDEQHVIGVITDRDIAMAEALQHKSAGEITVGDVVHQAMVSICHAEDDIEAVLEKMETGKVRRLPVVDDSDHVTGMVSLADITAYAGTDKKASCTATRLVAALKAITTPHLEEDKLVSRA